jgi:hypothetical protein
MRAIAILIPLLIMGCASNKVMEPSPLLNGGKGHPGDLRRMDTVHEGNLAPDFKLKTLDGSKSVRLSKFRGQKPVVLIFGSYT